MWCSGTLFSRCEIGATQTKVRVRGVPRFFPNAELVESKDHIRAAQEFDGKIAPTGGVSTAGLALAVQLLRVNGSTTLVDRDGAGWLT